MPNYKKSFFLSFFIHLGIIFLVIVLVLFFHIKYKKKETFIEVKLYKTSKSANKHHKSATKQSVSHHKIIKHYIKHKKIEKKIVYRHKQYHKHQIIKHLLKHSTVIKKYIKNNKPIHPKHLIIHHTIIEKHTISRIKKIKSDSNLITEKTTTISKKNKNNKAIINKVKKSNITPMMAQKIRHDYFDYLYELINAHKTYPAVARELQQEGVVKISFLLLNNGDILHIKVIKSSDFNSLDTAAKDILIHLHKIKPIPKSLSLKPLHVVVPIDYTLN